MFFKSCTELFNKHLFSSLIAASLVIHALIIFLSPQANHFISLSSLRESFIREPSEYAVALEFENADTQIEDTSSDTRKDESELKKEEEKKKKYKIFTDTSDNTASEKTTVDTDKIGEKGSIAKDNLPDDKQPINNEPSAEGHSKAPLLGKGVTGLPVEGQQTSQGQEAPAQAFLPEDNPQDKNSPPKFANLPQGLEKQEEPARQPEEKKEKADGAETEKLDKMVKTENIIKTLKRERLSIGRDTRQEEAIEPVSDREGVLLTDKQEEEKKDSEIKEESLPPSFQEQETVKKEDVKAENPNEIKKAKNTETPKHETPVYPTESEGVEPQRRLERGLDEVESQSALKKPKVSINVNAKKEGAKNDPVLFEDTISNAAIPGAPSFNVKEHEYAAYFKHIRDRISLYWFLGYGTRAEIKLETKNDQPIIIEFKVLPDGSIDDVNIVDDAGNFPLASRLISSVKNAAPLNPFPSNIKEPSIDVRFNFYFF